MSQPDNPHDSQPDIQSDSQPDSQPYDMNTTAIMAVNKNQSLAKKNKSILTNKTELESTFANE